MNEVLHEFGSAVTRLDSGDIEWEELDDIGRALADWVEFVMGLLLL